MNNSVYNLLEQESFKELYSVDKFELKKTGNNQAFFYFNDRKSNKGRMLRVITIPKEEEGSEKILKLATHSIELLESLKGYKNLINIEYKHIDLENYRIFLVSRYFEKDLSNLLEVFEKKLEKGILYHLVQTLITSLKSAHSMEITHKDLSLRNIFISGKQEYFIGNWGVTKFYKKLACPAQIYAMLDEDRYCPPEGVNYEESQTIDYYKADVYSLGLVILICCGISEIEFKKPYNKMHETEHDKAMNDHISKVIQDYPELENVLRKILVFDHRKRCNISEALSSFKMVPERSSATEPTLAGTFLAPKDQICKYEKGEKIWPNGNKYFGEMKNGEMDGYGCLELFGGGTCRGEWRENKAHGWCELIEPNGTKYVGFMKDNMKHGKGVWEKVNGVKYDGFWANGKKEGKGVLKWGTRGSYEGEFKSGKQEGFGTLSTEEGELYFGYFKDGKRDGQGKFQASDGSIYEGEWSEDQKHGKGTLIWSSGDYYQGDFKNNQFDGIGTIKTRGQTYTGDWVANKREGKGTLNEKNGDYYHGSFQNNKKNGKGIKMKVKGDIYEGNWLDDTMNGEGEYRWPNGDVYKGNFKKNIKEGFGIFVGNQGIRYEGEWENDQMNGEGTLTYQNGDEFKGIFRKFKKSGYGTFTTKSGEIYKGSWFNDKKDGLGRQFYSNGDVYDGSFQNDRKSGRGTLKKENGEIYEGCWAMDLRNGYGSFLGTDGSIYEGHYKNDKRQGNGKLTFTNGDFYNGEWRHDRMCGSGELYNKERKEKYIGGFLNNQKNGRGRLIKEDRSILEGEWKDDDLNGIGRFIAPTGETYEGTYENGVFSEECFKIIKPFRKIRGLLKDGVFIVMSSMGNEIDDLLSEFNETELTRILGGEVQDKGNEPAFDEAPINYINHEQTPSHSYDQNVFRIHEQREARAILNIQKKETKTIKNNDNKEQKTVHNNEKKEQSAHQKIERADEAPHLQTKEELQAKSEKAPAEKKKAEFNVFEGENYKQILSMYKSVRENKDEKRKKSKEKKREVRSKERKRKESRERKEREARVAREREKWCLNITDGQKKANTPGLWKQLLNRSVIKKKSESRENDKDKVQAGDKEISEGKEKNAENEIENDKMQSPIERRKSEEREKKRDGKEITDKQKKDKKDKNRQDDLASIKSKEGKKEEESKDKKKVKKDRKKSKNSKKVKKRKDSSKGRKSSSSRKKRKSSSKDRKKSSSKERRRSISRERKRCSSRKRTRSSSKDRRRSRSRAKKRSSSRDKKKTTNRRKSRSRDRKNSSTRDNKLTITKERKRSSSKSIKIKEERKKSKEKKVKKKEDKEKSRKKKQGKAEDEIGKKENMIKTKLKKTKRIKKDEGDKKKSKTRKNEPKEKTELKEGGETIREAPNFEKLQLEKNNSNGNTSKVLKREASDEKLIRETIVIGLPTLMQATLEEERSDVKSMVLKGMGTSEIGMSPKKEELVNMNSYHEGTKIKESEHNNLLRVDFSHETSKEKGPKPAEEEEKLQNEGQICERNIIRKDEMKYSTHFFKAEHVNKLKQSDELELHINNLVILRENNEQARLDDKNERSTHSSMEIEENLKIIYRNDSIKQRRNLEESSGKREDVVHKHNNTDTINNEETSTQILKILIILIPFLVTFMLFLSLRRND